MKEDPKEKKIEKEKKETSTARKVKRAADAKGVEANCIKY